MWYVLVLAICFTKNKNACKQENKCKPIWSNDCPSSLLILVERWRWGWRLWYRLPRCGWTVAGTFCVPSWLTISPHGYLERDLRERLHLKTPLQHAQMHLLNKLTLISEEASIKENDTWGDLRAVGTCRLSLCQNSICASMWVRCESRGCKILDISIRLNSRNPFLFGVAGI